MKKIVLLAVAGFLAAQASYAQQTAPPNQQRTEAVATQPAAKGNGKVSGVIQDEATKAPVEYASVALILKATGKIIDGAMADDKGRFSIIGVAPAEYRLSISFMGYETRIVDNVTVSSGKVEVNLGTVNLKSVAKALGEVTVVGEKPLIEDEIDRIVYNAEKDINTGGTAAEVMRKVPGLSVDLEGNVQLRGSSNIRVLINNKPSAVMASSIAEALQQIPADHIKSIEVITSPSAKYDAEGTAGIINIITKKDSGLQGLTGNVFAAYGTISSNTNAALNYRKNRLGLNTTVGYNRSKGKGINTVNSVFGPGSEINSLYSRMDGLREGSSAFVQLGADYEISNTSYIAAGVRFSAPDITISSTQVTSSTFASEPDQNDTRIGTNRLVGNNYDINLDYTKTFKNKGQELSVLGLLSRNSRNNENFMKLFEEAQELQKEQNFNDAYNEEITAQTDYMHPVSETQQLEVGTKAIWRYAESDYRFLVANPASAPLLLQPDRTDVFSYNQDVLASYATYSLKLNKKSSVKFGVRHEYTDVHGDFSSKLTTVDQNYHSFFPSLSVANNLTENQSVKFNYSRRIQRPQLSYLNPYENLSNPKNVQRGNPKLEAELTDTYELGYNTFFKSGLSINTALYLHQTNNSIQQISSIYSGTNPDSIGRVTNTVGNVGQNSSYGMSLTGNAKFLKKGRINSNINAFYTTVKNRREGRSNSGMMYNANLNLAYNFEKGISAQLSGEYNSPQVNLQGEVSSWVAYNLAVRKEILNKKGTITVGLNNPFDKTVSRKRTINTYDAEQNLVLAQENNWHFYMRQVRVAFNYQFGKQDMKTKPRRIKKVTNDDAKEGESTGMQ